MKRRDFILLSGWLALSSALPAWAEGEGGDAQKRWQNLTPEQQQQVRERWEKFKNLSPEQKTKIREAFKRFRQLP
ncbi:MAG: DUF3106 domain-containing protein, partial [Bdellovibrionales bacterium]